MAPFFGAHLPQLDRAAAPALPHWLQIMRSRDQQSVGPAIRDRFVVATWGVVSQFEIWPYWPSAPKIALGSVESATCPFINGHNLQGFTYC